jgi:hypothetical protein
MDIIIGNPFEKQNHGGRKQGESIGYIQYFFHPIASIIPTGVQDITGYPTSAKRYDDSFTDSRKTGKVLRHFIGIGPVYRQRHRNIDKGITRHVQETRSEMFSNLMADIISRRFCFSIPPSIIDR